MRRVRESLVVMAWLASCVGPTAAEVSADLPRPARLPAVPAVSLAPLPRAVDAVLEGMSLEAKVGQLMMVGFKGPVVDGNVRALVQGLQVGGVCLFAGNIASAAQVAELNDELRALTLEGIPLFIAVDQEGGSVVRVDDGNLVLPGAMLLGAAGDPSLAFEAGLEQGRDLWRLGFNMNFAPVLDVNSNPNNPVIGVRAFGDDPSLVARLGERFVEGQQAASIVTVAKHFPGHGAVDADSHLQLPVLSVPLEAFRSQLAPFSVAAKAGLDGMMTAHVAVPTLSGDDTPATLSPRVLGGVLRDELSFDGLVMTDELEMGAIGGRYGVGTAAVMAINAGADMVLVPWRNERKAEVHQALLEAARSGRIEPRRLDQAARHVLSVKLERGVFEPLPPRAVRLATLGARRELAQRIARAGVTLVRADASFPLPPRAPVVVVATGGALADALAPSVSVVERVELPAAVGPADVTRARRAGRARASAVVVEVASTAHLALVEAAAAAGTPVLAVVTGAPYLATRVPAARAVVVVYSSRPAAVHAAAEALTGERGTPGRLPVTLPGLPLGFGLDPVGSSRVTLSAPSTASPRR